MYPDMFDYTARTFTRLDEHNKATRHAKTVSARDEFVGMCVLACQQLCAASTATTNLNVDCAAVGAALADLILSSPAQ